MSRIKKRYVFLAALIVILGWGVIAARYYFYDLFHIPSEAMHPAIKKGDYLLVYKGDFQPKRGQVVVFEHPKETGKFLVKRIIAIGGDQIRLINGRVILNGKKLHYTENPLNEGEERYFREFITQTTHYEILDSAKTQQDRTPLFTVPEKYYFVLGDNRDQSIDSRFSRVGFIAEAQIKGIADKILYRGEEKKIMFRDVPWGKD